MVTPPRSISSHAVEGTFSAARKDRGPVQCRETPCSTRPFRQPSQQRSAKEFFVANEPEVYRPTMVTVAPGRVAGDDGVNERLPCGDDASEVVGPFEIVPEFSRYACNETTND